jgi:putative nucleotidyltransferase with HDIG domain
MSEKLATARHDLSLRLSERGYTPVAEVLVATGLSEATVRQLGAAVAREAARQSPLSEQLIDDVVRCLSLLPLDEGFTERANVLLDCARYYQGISKHPIARNLSRQLLTQAESASNASLQRRIHNSLGAFCLDAANFQECLEHLQTAIELATGLRDEISLGACLANAMSALKELGHYHDAIAASKFVLQIDSDSPNVQFLKFQCAGNGLFCAHRLQDPSLAIRFLESGNELLLSANLDVVSKATYEYYRAAYLVDTFDHETAQDLIAAAVRNLSPDKNPRVAVLLRLSEALCEWATREDAGFASSRKKLRELYEITKKSRLYHDDVLRALMKVHGNAMDNETAKLGIRYAKELVEYTTSVKRAKFYRQLSDRGVELEPAPPKLEYPFDPFANVRQWLAPVVADASPEGKPVDAIHGPELHANKRQVAKHEELAAIHDDLAKLRTDALLKEIRSVAYDTAENWALAAEFFDDQTGQHCFRVGHLAGMLAREIGMEGAYCARIEHAARLHDIGKIGVNEMILLKPGPLDPSELTAMRAHAEVGAYMLQGAKDPVLQMAAVIAKHHHEWWNGAGYPASLADRGIPLAARICALADVYDALTHARPYKGAWPHRVAVEEMLNLSGVQFDPHLIRPFLRVLERYVPALAEGRIPGLAQLRTNGLIASRKKLMETISSSQV